jgi:hypothetical protein
MDIVKILKDSLRFFAGQWQLLFLLTFPWIVLETSLQSWLIFQFKGLKPAEISFSAEHMLAAVFSFVIWCYIQACFTLFMFYRTYQNDASISQILRKSWSYTPPLMVTFTLVASAIFLMSIPAAITGILPLIILALWCTIRLAYAAFFVVVEQLTPMNAVKASIEFTKHLFWPTAFIFSLFFVFSIFFNLLAQVSGDDSFYISVMLDSLFSFLALFISIAFFRLYCLERQPEQFLFKEAKSKPTVERDDEL